MNYWERHIGDYAKDTAHLTMIEHGAYTLLLDRYYDKEQGIPVDKAHRVCRARTEEERAAVDTVLEEFFTQRDGLWVKRRIEEEIERAGKRIAAAKANGSKGGRPGKTKKEPSGLPSGNDSAYGQQTQVEALHTPDPIHQTPGNSVPDGTGDQSPLPEGRWPDAAGGPTPPPPPPRSVNDGGPDWTPFDPSLAPQIDDIRDVIPLPSKGPRQTDPAEVIFGMGLSLLTNADVGERNARSFLGRMRKIHGDELLIGAINRCYQDRPLQPLEYIGGLLPATGGRRPNRQEQLEAGNRRVVEDWVSSNASHDDGDQP